MNNTSKTVLHLEPVGLHPVSCKGSSITFVLDSPFSNWTWNFRPSIQCSFPNSCLVTSTLAVLVQPVSTRRKLVSFNVCLFGAEQLVPVSVDIRLGLLVPYHVQVSICSLVKSASLNSQERPNLAKSSWNENVLLH